MFLFSLYSGGTCFFVRGPRPADAAVWATWEPGTLKNCSRQFTFVRRGLHSRLVAFIGLPTDDVGRSACLDAGAGQLLEGGGDVAGLQVNAAAGVLDDARIEPQPAGVERGELDAVIGRQPVRNAPATAPASSRSAR